MPIVVRNDPDYLNAYAQLAMQRRSQSQDYQPPPDADENPYTMSLGKGAAVSAKLAQDRERLGAKQKAEYGAVAFKDSAAGFDWLTPISINGHKDDQGRPLNTTVYRNDGKDPLATGAWGALGSAEHQINDPGGVIDPRDFRDRQAVEALSRSGISGDVSEDPFLTPEQREDKKFTRGLGNKKKEMEMADEFAVERDKRGFAATAARDQVLNGIQDQRDQTKRTREAGENLDKAKGAGTGFFGTDFSDPSTIKLLGPDVAAELQKKKNQYGAIIANKGPDFLSPEAQAAAMENVVKSASEMLKLAQRDQMQQFEPVLDANGNPTGLQRDGKGRFSAIPVDYNTKLADKRADKATDMEAEYKQFQRKELYRKQLEEQFKPQGATPAQSFQAWREAEEIRKYNGKSLDPNEIQKDAAVILNKILGNSGSVGMSPPAIMNQSMGSRNPIVIPAEQAASTMQTILKLKAQGLSPDQIREKLRGQ